MNNVFKGLLEDWSYVRGITKIFIEKLSDADLDRELPRDNLNTIRKQCEELLEVQSCYIKALDQGVVDFDGYSDKTMLGNKSKEELLDRCDKLDLLLIDKLSNFDKEKTINWFGQERGISFHISAMSSHESMHIGQVVAFCYSENIAIPQEIVSRMALSN